MSYGCVSADRKLALLDKIQKLTNYTVEHDYFDDLHVAFLSKVEDFEILEQRVKSHLNELEKQKQQDESARRKIARDSRHNKKGSGWFVSLGKYVKDNRNQIKGLEEQC